MKIVKEEFASIRELLKVLSSRPNNAFMNGQHHSTRQGRKDFTGTNTYEEAVSLFENGYKDVLPQIKEGLEKNIRATGNHERRFVRNGVVGYAPNVPNAIQGLPNSMIYTEKQIQKVKAVSIFYSPTANCGTRVETFIKSGICVLSAINILELSGVRVNLNVIMFNAANDSETEGTRVSVKVKDYREHMDVLKLCFPVVHPSLFRRFGFKWLETSPGITEGGWAGTYGHHCPKMYNLTRDGLKENEYFVGLKETEDVEYSPEALIDKLGIKK